MASREELERLDEAGLRAWDQHDSEGFTKLLADDFVWVDDTEPDPIRTRDAARDYAEAWFTAFPDVRYRETNRVIGEDSIAAELEFTGTHTGPLDMGGMRVAPTGRKVVGSVNFFAKAENGRIKEFHTHPDAMGVMSQLGLMSTTRS